MPDDEITLFVPSESDRDLDAEHAMDRAAIAAGALDLYDPWFPSAETAQTWDGVSTQANDPYIEAGDDNGDR